MKKNNKKGFTLVELVIVVAVMAVLVAVAIPTVSSITGTAKDTVADSNARTIESIIKLAEADASKATDGVAELDPEDVAQALYDAKLGINSSTAIHQFNYNPDTGVVTAIGTKTRSANDVKEWLIDFKKVTPTGGTEAEGVSVIPSDGTAQKADKEAKVNTISE